MSARQTYIDRILADLSDGAWCCGSYWYGRMMPTFSQRISELNAREPGRIESRPCTVHGHRHRGPIHEYRDTTVRLRLFA